MEHPLTRLFYQKSILGANGIFNVTHYLFNPDFFIAFRMSRNTDSAFLCFLKKCCRIINNTPDTKYSISPRVIVLSGVGSFSILHDFLHDISGNHHNITPIKIGTIKHIKKYLYAPYSQKVDSKNILQ